MISNDSFCSSCQLRTTTCFYKLQACCSQSVSIVKWIRVCFITVMFSRLVGKWWRVCCCRGCCTRATTQIWPRVRRWIFKLSERRYQCQKSSPLKKNSSSPSSLGWWSPTPSTTKQLLRAYLLWLFPKLLHMKNTCLFSEFSPSKSSPLS